MPRSKSDLFPNSDEDALNIGGPVPQPSDFPDLDAVDGVGVPYDDAAPQPEDTPAEGYSPTDGPTDEEAALKTCSCDPNNEGEGCNECYGGEPPEIENDPTPAEETPRWEAQFAGATDECPHGYFVGRDCPEGCVDDEGQRAGDAVPLPSLFPVAEDESPDPPVYTEAELDAMVEVPEGRAPDGDEGLSDAPLDGDEESADDIFAGTTFFESLYNNGWNDALDALAGKFSRTGAFLEVQAAIDKLRK